MASQLIIPRALDANGDSASGALAYVYETGTTTPVTVYTDTGLSVAHASPIVANSAGYFAQAFYGGSTALKVVVQDSTGSTLVTYDPVPLVSLSNAAASDVTFSPVTENTALDVQSAIAGITDGTADFSSIQIDSAVKTGVTGADPLLVTGTPGAAGDVATWNADGDLVGGTTGGMDFIISRDASGGASLEFTEFDATKYDSYLFVLEGIVNASGTPFLDLQTSTNGGSTWDSGASDYAHVRRQNSMAVSPTDSLVGDDADSQIILAGSSISSSGAGVSGTVRIYSAGLAKYTAVDWSLIFDAGSLNMSNGSGYRLSAADVDGVKFFFSGSTNTASGTITMYGLRNA